MKTKFELYENAWDLDEIVRWLNKLNKDDVNIEGVLSFQVIESGRSYEERHDPEHLRFSCIAQVRYWDDEEKQANREMAHWEAEQEKNKSRPD